MRKNKHGTVVDCKTQKVSSGSNSNFMVADLVEKVNLKRSRTFHVAVFSRGFFFAFKTKQTSQCWLLKSERILH